MVGDRWQGRARRQRLLPSRRLRGMARPLAGEPDRDRGGRGQHRLLHQARRQHRLRRQRRPGLAMATMDTLKLHSGEPANFLDIGTVNRKDRVIEALRIIVNDPDVKTIFINIFGGLARVDIVAEGVVDAVNELKIQQPLVVRLNGSNVEEPPRLARLRHRCETTADELGDAAALAVEAAKSDVDAAARTAKARTEHSRTESERIRTPRTRNRRMSILLNNRTRLLIQGLGNEGQNQIRRSLGLRHQGGRRRASRISRRRQLRPRQSQLPGLLNGGRGGREDASQLLDHLCAGAGRGRLDSRKHRGRSPPDRLHHRGRAGPRHDPGAPPRWPDRRAN